MHDGCVHVCTWMCVLCVYIILCVTKTLAVRQYVRDHTYIYSVHIKYIVTEINRYLHSLLLLHKHIGIKSDSEFQQH